MTVRVIGEEWYKDGAVAALPPDLPDCPICGAQHTTCTRDVRIEMAKAEQKATETGAAKQENENAAERAQARAGDNETAANAPTDGKVIRAQAPNGDNVRLPELGEPDEPMVVEENVYQEFYPANTRRPSYRLLFHKGQVVMKSAYDAAVKG